MFDLELKRFLHRVYVPIATNDRNMFTGDPSLGGLCETGKVTLALHTDESQPSLAIAKRMLPYRAKAGFRVIDIKGSLATACNQNDLDLNGSLIDALRLPRCQRRLAVMQRLKALAETPGGPHTVFVAGLDGLGSLDQLSRDTKFIGALQAFVADGRSIIATALTSEYYPFSAAAAARKIADRVFGVERVWPAAEGTTRFRLTNVTDRHELDEPTFAYSGRNMTEKLASMLS